MEKTPSVAIRARFLAAAIRRQQRLDVIGIGVAIMLHGGTGKLRPGMDASVRQFIDEDEIVAVRPAPG